ncbi:MAG: shikimate kinase [Pseudomonadota bacterium]
MIRFGLKKHRAVPHTQAATLRGLLGQRPIVLVGLMGCGKSSVGRRLAGALNLAFADTDHEIEKAAGQTIPEIFAEHGETYFREGERKVIARLLTDGPQVLATGGGAYMDAITRDNIASSAVSVWLKATLPILLERALRRDNRPLLQTDDPEAVMRDLMEKRYPVYAHADVTVESRNVSHETVVGDIIDALLGHLQAERAP